MLRPLSLGAPQVVAVRRVPEPLRSPPEEVMSVNVSIPLIALVAIVAYIAYRHMGLRAWHAIVCAGATLHFAAIVAGVVLGPGGA